jgi:hypothetical protein
MSMFGTQRANAMPQFREDSTVTDIVTSPLTHIVLGVAALVATLPAIEPVGVRAEAAEPRPAARIVIQATDHAALVEVDTVRACGDVPTVCSAARMRWQVTLPAATVKRCPSSTCTAG